MEDFVSFEIAKKLKEKGFDWETTDIYEKNSLICRYEDYPKPHISEVLDWLRVEKKLHIAIRAEAKGFYWWEITDFNEETITKGFYRYKSNEYAVLAGINHVLDNLI